MLSNDEKKEALESVLEILKNDVVSMVILADNGNDDGTILVLGNTATALGLVRIAEHKVLNSL